MEDNKDKREVFDLNKNSKMRCMLCECIPGAHACFWSCPIFKDYPICSTCCTIDVLRSDIEKSFSEKLGKKITREEINKACADCGRNHAVQDDVIADRLVFNSFDNVIQENNDDTQKEDDEDKR